MEWLLKRFRKRPDEEAMALHLEALAQERDDAVVCGDHLMFGFSNAAAGRGYALHVLVGEGLMVSRYEPGLPGEGGRYRYSLTSDGRALRAELLAS